MRISRVCVTALLGAAATVALAACNATITIAGIPGDTPSTPPSAALTVAARPAVHQRPALRVTPARVTASTSSAAAPAPTAMAAAAAGGVLGFPGEVNLDTGSVPSPSYAPSGTASASATPSDSGTVTGPAASVTATANTEPASTDLAPVIVSPPASPTP